jgi:hypothetical protein
MVRTQVSKEHFGRQSISPHYTALEGHLRNERQVLNFVLVRLDNRRDSKIHGIGTNVLPEVESLQLYNQQETTATRR